MTILDLPPEARPRERLAEKGPDALSSIELIAILLGFGTKRRSALELASDLLVRSIRLKGCLMRPCKSCFRSMELGRPKRFSCKRPLPLETVKTPAQRCFDNRHASQGVSRDISACKRGKDRSIVGFLLMREKQFYIEK